MQNRSADVNPIILETLKSFDLSLYEPIHKRDLDLGSPLEPRAGNLVKVIVGMRRSGKSYRLFQEMQALLEAGIPSSRICYFNFEDERLAPLDPSVGDEVLEAFQTLHPDAFEAGAYLFFDELQEMENWEGWLRRIVDTRKATIYATGSSSKLLSTDIATGFRGRAIDFELLPLSFAEYVRFNGMGDLGAQEGYSTTERLRLQAAFSDYLHEGGFPAVQGLPTQEAIPILQSYVQRVVARDVIERHNLAKPRVATAFAQRVLGLNGRQLSLRKAANDLRSAGLPTSRELLGDVFGYLQDAYLAFAMRERTYSLAESTNAAVKAYAIDPGLALANARANTNDRGQRLENAVYLELRRRAIGMRKDAIASLRTKNRGYEVDFVLGDALDEAPFELFQVCDSVDDPATLKRELRALWEVMDEQGVREGTLIVGEGGDEAYEQGSCTVRQIPAWKWMLERP